MTTGWGKHPREYYVAVEKNETRERRQRQVKELAQHPREQVTKLGSVPGGRHSTTEPPRRPKILDVLSAVFPIVQ